MMRIRISAILLALCLLLVSVPAAAERESHSEAWLDRWARELFEEAQKQPALDEQPEVPLSGRLILVYAELSGKCNVYCKYGGPKTDPRPQDPFFQPVWSNGQPLYPDIPASCWADSVEDCDWLIVYGGFETGRNKGFYGGNIDRVIVTTRVYVLDPREKKIVLTRTIGTDTPASRTSNPTGKVLSEQAKDYIIRLITSQE